MKFKQKCPSDKCDKWKNNKKNCYENPVGKGNLVLNIGEKTEEKYENARPPPRLQQKCMVFVITLSNKAQNCCEIGKKKTEDCKYEENRVSTRDDYYIPKLFLPFEMPSIKKSSSCMPVKILYQINQTKNKSFPIINNQNTYYKILIPHHTPLRRAKKYNCPQKCHGHIKYPEHIKCPVSYTCYTKNLDISNPMVFCPDRKYFNFLKKRCLFHPNLIPHSKRRLHQLKRNYPHCKSAGRFVNPHDPFGYYLCYPHEQNVLKIPMKCPNNMYFDKDLSICVK